MSFKFGALEGVSKGDTFPSRKSLGESGVHAPIQSGIWGREKEGACSIVLSGGYENDIDNLDYIKYTGEGGLDSRKKLVRNQEFTRGNRALQLSFEYNLPVRVSRGYQIPNGPTEGYRYDGLYYINFVERVKVDKGFFVCRFHLQSEDSLGDLEKKLLKTFKKTYSKTTRVETSVSRIERNVALAEKIKDLYGNRCQVCGVYLKKPTGAISIGAHIKGLGKPHEGPDSIQNMICLCPNHHAQFDAFSFYIEPTNFEIAGLEGYKGKKLKVSARHKIDKSFLAYHKSLCFHLIQ